MQKQELRQLVKQALGNRTSTLGTQTDDEWYDNRVLDGYRRLVTEQGITYGPGHRGVTRRVLRFPLLHTRKERTLDAAAFAGNGNWISNQSGVSLVFDLYDRTNDQPLGRPPDAAFVGRDPDETGKILEWIPSAQDGVMGYRVWRTPSDADDTIDVYEFCLLEPTLPLDTSEPATDPEWHLAIAFAGAAMGALLLDWPEKEKEMENRYADYLRSRFSMSERADFTGKAGRRTSIRVGSW